MKKLFGSILTMLAFWSVSSCGSDLTPLERGNSRGKGQNNMQEVATKTFMLKLAGDWVSESDEPLLRADDEPAYVGVNVFRTAKTSGSEVASEEKYAYGLFSGLNNISIDLVTGYTYRFEASITIDKKDKLNTLTDNIEEPFLSKDDNTTDGQSFPKSNIGDFIYTHVDADSKAVSNDQRVAFSQLSLGKVRVADGMSIYTYNYPRMSRYYGVYGATNGFDPEVSKELEIQMDYKCFGLKIVIENLPVGTVTVKDITKKNGNLKEDNEKLQFPSDLKFDKDSEPWEEVYSMYKLTAESESITLQFAWDKGDGSKEEKFSAEISVAPKKKKVLKLNFSGSGNAATKGNISFDMQDETLVDDPATIVNNKN